MNSPADVLRALTIGACLFGAALAQAHEGHGHDADHDDDAPAATAPPAAGAVSTPQIELVATRARGELLIYIDDYASNAPIDGLQVQLRSGNQLLQAAAAGDGVYRLPADLIETHNAEPATFLIHGARLDLQVQVVLPDAPAAAEPPRRSRVALIVALAGALLVALLGSLSLGLRRRRRSAR